MIRRPATTITLTPEDILKYDESVQQRTSFQIDRNQEQSLVKNELAKDNQSNGPIRTTDFNER